MTNRKEEIRNLLNLTPETIISKAGKHLVVVKNLKILHQHLAESIAKEVVENNEFGRNTRLILPVGPTGQYPILVKIFNKLKISLKNCWFFFMDEYCDDEGKALSSQHPLSFKGVINTMFLNELDESLGLDQNRVIFPDEHNITELSKKIDDLGGIETCYGGIGIHGHLAFNEPEANVSKSEPRKVKLNDYTITINAIRANIGGNLENFPRHAYTLGMRQILDSRKIRLYCRNGISFDWANSILRISLLGRPGDDYPVTHIRGHPDYEIITDRDTISTPKFII